MNYKGSLCGFIFKIKLFLNFHLKIQLSQGKRTRRHIAIELNIHFKDKINKSKNFYKDKQSTKEIFRDISCLNCSSRIALCCSLVFIVTVSLFKFWLKFIFSIKKLQIFSEKSLHSIEKRRRKTK